MNKNTQITALIAGLALAPVAAFAAVNVGDQVGIDETAIQAALEAQGYQVQEFEIEADEIEVMALLDGQLFEIEVDPATGEILEVELEDDDDEDDDEDDDDEAETDAADEIVADEA